MNEYSLAEQFALIALNAQDCQRDTAAKRIAILGIAAAKELQNLLWDQEQEALDKLEAMFEERIQKVRSMSRRQQKELEQEFAGMLKEEGVLTEIPNLLGCDMNYYTADITMRE